MRKSTKSPRWVYPLLVIASVASAAGNAAAAPAFDPAKPLFTLGSGSASALSDQSSEVLAPASILSGTVSPIAIPAVASAPLQNRWTLREGRPIQDELERWAGMTKDTAEPWRFVWNVKPSWLVPGNVTLEGTFDEVVTQVIRSLGRQDTSVSAKIWEGNRVIEIGQAVTNKAATDAVTRVADAKLIGGQAPRAISEAPTPYSALPLLDEGRPLALPDGQAGVGEYAPKTWKVSPEDKTFRESLVKWAAKANWTFEPVHWTMPIDIPVVGSAEFTGDFKDAVRGLMRATEMTKTPAQPCFYSNRVLRIVPYSVMCDRMSVE